jgi:transposase-like protein
VFAADYGTKWPKAAAKITDELDVLLAFYDYPAGHWIHLRTTNPTESTFATVRLRQRVTKGPGSRAAGVAMAFKLIESAQTR